MSDHLPECPAPLCDWGDPSAECMGYEDCHHLCCCAALRACEQRVRDELFPRGRAEQLETARVNGWHSGWNAAIEDGYNAGLDAAREAVAALFPQERYPHEHAAIFAAIDALRGQPADQAGYKPPDAP